jgi:hypothetical protein
MTEPKYAIVPVEATQQMLWQLEIPQNGDPEQSDYANMLTAAPPPPDIVGALEELNAEIDAFWNAPVHSKYVDGRMARSFEQRICVAQQKCGAELLKWYGRNGGES